MSAVPPRGMGRASGVNSTLQRFGIALVIAVAADVFTANGRLGTPESFAAGFQPALGVVAAVSVLGAVSAVAVGARRRAAIASEPAMAELQASA